jgi:RimJ/RimL family protein N-acetyltransferase
MALPDSFMTERLRAERLTADDLPEIRRMHGDPAVMQHLGGVRDEAQTKAYFDRNLKHWSDHGFGLWIVHERGGREPIGRAMLRHLFVDDTDEIEVGYAFYESFWGRGLATEVTRACLSLGHRMLSRPSIVAVTYPHNTASQHVLTKTGFAYERDVTLDGVRCFLFRTKTAT